MQLVVTYEDDGSFTLSVGEDRYRLNMTDILKLNLQIDNAYRMAQHARE